MSIATAIQNAQQKVADAYTAISNKGGTLPATQNLSNMPTAISSIPSGGGTDNLPAFISDGVSSYTDNTITKIRPYAFTYMNSSNSTNSLTSVSCSNVTELGKSAFDYCSQLTSVYLPSLLTAKSSSFYHCTGLTSISLPSLTKAETRCFAYCSNLTSVSLPSLQTVGSYIFDSCTSLTSLTVPSTVNQIDSYAFSGLGNMEEFNYNATNATYSTATNSNNVFQALGKNKANLVFNIGNNVEKIPDGFLYPYNTTTTYKPNIKTLNIPNNNSITYIGSYAFYQNTVLPSSVSLPNALTLKDNAFYGCSNITDISLPNVTTISDSCFRDCSKLTSISLPSITSITSNCSNFAYSCSKLETISFPNLTTISGSGSLSSACQSCSKLTSVNFSSLSSITSTQALYMMFRSCSSLTSLSFPALTSTSFGSTYTNQFNKMLSGVTGCTVHFPSNLQSVIGSWSDVTAGFGGTNTTVLFDLPATN